MLKIPVNDVEQAADFYRDVLGFKQEFVVPEYGWAQFTIGELPLGLYVPGKRGGNRSPGGSIDFQLLTDDLEALHQRCVAAGAETGEGIVTSNDGLAFFEVSDPDGNILKIIKM